MEYSKENTMTRKEYLKSKNKMNFDFSKIKYILIIAVIILLSIYLYKQLNIYNNVTKIANNVVEETALLKTMKMYYIQDSYTKNKNTSLVLYKSSDESRTNISNSEGIINILYKNDIIYGLKNDGLYVLDNEKNELTKIIDKKIEKFVVQENNIYYYYVDSKNNKNTGIYVFDTLDNIEKQIISAKIFDFDVSENYIYAVMSGTTSRSIFRFNLQGKFKKEISGKYIVNQIKCIENKVYFNTTKNYKLYYIDNGINKITDNKVIDIFNVVKYNKNIYYINGSDNNTLYCKSQKSDERIIKKNIDSIEIDENIIYYKIKNTIEIYKYDTNTKNTAQVTSVRTSKYICKN